MKSSLSVPQMTSIYGSSQTTSVPNYMAATASAKARYRSQSAPRQRNSTLEKENIGSVKKRLTFPAPDPHGGGTDVNTMNYQESEADLDNRSCLLVCNRKASSNGALSDSELRGNERSKRKTIEQTNAVETWESTLRTLKVENAEVA